MFAISILLGRWSDCMLDWLHYYGVPVTQLRNLFAGLEYYVWNIKYCFVKRFFLFHDKFILKYLRFFIFNIWGVDINCKSYGLFIAYLFIENGSFIRYTMSSLLKDSDTFF